MTHLKNHRVLESRDPDEVQMMIKDLSSPHKVVLKGDQSRYDAVISAAPLDELQIVHYGFGDVEMDVIAPDEDADALLLLMFDSGNGRATHGKTEWEISSRAGIMRDIRKPLRSEQCDLGGFVIMLPKERLRRQAQALLGDEALRTELAFDPVVDFTTPEATLLRSTVEYIATALDGPLREIDDTIVRAQLEDSLLTQVLTLLPNNLQDLLRPNGAATVVPYYLKRACDYIQANASRPVTGAALAEAASCSYRTLQTAFREVYGQSPTAYLRAVRLQEVRRCLLAADDGTVIADVARQWGFNHLSRFAEAYRRQFGELPSETLRRRS